MIMEKIYEYAGKIKGKFSGTELEQKLNRATGNERYMHGNADLYDIADASYHYEECDVIIGHITNKLGTQAKNWEIIFKTLYLIEFLLRSGDPKLSRELQKYAFKIRMLETFSHMDKDGIERGSGIRETSTKINSLLNDPELLEEEREKGRQIREKMSGVSGAGISSAAGRDKYGSISSSNYTGPSGQSGRYGGMSYDNYTGPAGGHSSGGYVDKGNKGGAFGGGFEFGGDKNLSWSKKEKKVEDSDSEEDAKEYRKRVKSKRKKDKIGGSKKEKVNKIEVEEVPRYPAPVVVKAPAAPLLEFDEPEAPTNQHASPPKPNLLMDFAVVSEPTPSTMPNWASTTPAANPIDWTNPPNAGRNMMPQNPAPSGNQFNMFEGAQIWSQPAATPPAQRPQNSNPNIWGSPAQSAPPAMNVNAGGFQFVSPSPPQNPPMSRAVGQEEDLFTSFQVPQGSRSSPLQVPAMETAVHKEEETQKDWRKDANSMFDLDQLMKESPKKEPEKKVVQQMGVPFGYPTNTTQWNNPYVSK